MGMMGSHLTWKTEVFPSRVLIHWVGQIEGDLQSATPVFPIRLKRGTALNEVLMLLKVGESIHGEKKKEKKEKNIYTFSIYPSIIS